ncbi:MAG TPA: FHA domain-containing protein [Gaiellaceae bacterium]|nr:FHA domain-containing protein [Gaiellaceae bacterium]
MERDAALILPDGTVQDLAAEVTVGRARENDVVVEKGGVSRRHARLVKAEGRWYVEDRGSLYGTYLNGVRLQPRVPYSLRHADRIAIGPDTFIFFARAQVDDPDDTARFALSTPPAGGRELSPFQRQVVQALCAPWLAGGSLDDLPLNEEIAAQLGTPGATESVKAALRRAYAKAGLAGESAGKRRKLCVAARQRGWI